MIIKPLADHPEHAATIGKWHWDEWGHADPNGNLDSWVKGIEARNLPHSIPGTFLALDDGKLLGSVSLVENDMDSRPDIRPWLAGLYVDPAERNRGVGSALTRYAMNIAFNLGVSGLYLYTSTAAAMYERLGWIEVDRDYYEGENVIIMMARNT